MSYPCTSSFNVDWEVLQTRIRVRCRRCENCMLARRHKFMIRAAREQIRAKHTWFVTLTFGPRRRSAILAAASRLDHRKDQSARLVQASGWYVTTFTKRLRAAGFDFRYLFVAEPHRDGFPHYHGLLHDQSSALSWDGISDEWNAGYSVVKLVRDVGAIRYVTKYIAKGRYGRIRCSSGYGAEDRVSDPASDNNVCTTLDHQQEAPLP